MFENKNYCKNHYNKYRYPICTYCKKQIDKLTDKYREIQSSGNKFILHEPRVILITIGHLVPLNDLPFVLLTVSSFLHVSSKNNNCL